MVGSPLPPTQPAPSPLRDDDEFLPTQAAPEVDVPPPPPRVAFVLEPALGSAAAPIELRAGLTTSLGSRHDLVDVVLVDEGLRAAGVGQFVSGHHANVSVRVNEGLDVVYITALSSKTTGRACGVWLGEEKLEAHVESRVGVGARVHLGALVTLAQKPYEGFVYELHKVDVLPDGPLRAGRGAPAAAPVGTSKNAKKRAKKRARNEDLAHENADLKAELARRDDAARLDKKHRTNETRVASSGRRVDVDFEFDVSVPICRDYNNGVCQRPRCRYRHVGDGGRRCDRAYAERRARGRGRRRA